MAIELTGTQKLAILFVSLGAEAASKIFKYFKEDEIDALTLEIANLPRVSTEDSEKVMAEFQQRIVEQGFIAYGGIDYAREILKNAVGDLKAEEIINRTTASIGKVPFEFMKKINPQQLAITIQKEHPQTIAVIMAHLPSDKSAALLAQFSTELQIDVAKRVAQMDRFSPESLDEVEKYLEGKFTGISKEATTMGGVGGIDRIVELFEQSERQVEKNVLDGIAETNAELAEAIRKKMFTFEDLVKLDDRSAQRVLREVDSKDLALALKGSPDNIRELIFRNMPKRAVEMLKEEIEFLGPQKAKDVEEAQLKIINVIRQLEDAGEIVLPRAGQGGEKLIV